MKPARLFILSVIAALLAGPAVRATEPSLTVHEWGTFTTIAGSDGKPLPWWTPTLEGPAELPEFIQPVPNFTKAGRAHLMRMETPVIYFYPLVPMKVAVRVKFPGGILTEAFPAVHPWFPSTASPSPAYEWTVDLLPPGSINDAMLPEVAARGAHYRHAREVPAAWIVHGAPPPDPQAPRTWQAEKFIFYRGAGGGQFPVQARLSADDTFQIRPWSEMRGEAFFVRVKNGFTSWRSAEITAASAPGGSILEQTQAVPEPSAEVHAPASLATALKQALSSAGLSADEAAAMVATWTDAWFDEEGNRVLYLLPRAWVDAVLPLEITPQPRELRRVFVARAELLSQRQEEALATLLNSKAGLKRKQTELQALGLGRFASAALERAVQVKGNEMRSEYGRIAAQTHPEAQPSSKATP